MKKKTPIDLLEEEIRWEKTLYGCCICVILLAFVVSLCLGCTPIVEPRVDQLERRVEVLERFVDHVLRTPRIDAPEKKEQLLVKKGTK